MRRRPVHRGVALALLLATALACGPSSAKDLGVRGATWPVAEPDLLDAIAARLEALRDAGAFERWEAEAKTRARAHLEAPPRVPGIGPATEDRSRRLDPAVTVARDLAAPDGTVLAKAGTRVNPLDHVRLSRPLLLVDGTRAAEVAWALRYPAPATLVLVAGRPLALARAHRRPVFFDQGGAVARRFQVRATPSVVTQEGRWLRVVEVALDDGAGAER